MTYQKSLQTIEFKTLETLNLPVSKLGLSVEGRYNLVSCCLVSQFANLSPEDPGQIRVSSKQKLCACSPNWTYTKCCLIDPMDFEAYFELCVTVDLYQVTGCV